MCFDFFISNVASEVQLIFLGYTGLILCLGSCFGLWVFWFFFPKNQNLLLVNSVPPNTVKNVLQILPIEMETF